MLYYSKVSFLSRVQAITPGSVQHSWVPGASQTSEASLDISHASQ